MIERALRVSIVTALLLLPGLTVAAQNNHARGILMKSNEISPYQAVEARVIPQADALDVLTIDNIIAALYDVISGPSGRKRDWNRFRSLFAPGARLIPTGIRSDGKVGYQVLDVEGYISRAASKLETEGFFEREVARRTDTFGNIAQVFSTYESRQKEEDKNPFSRGINSIQLLFDGTRWWVMTVYWDSERPNNPIPKKYLKGKE